MPDFEARLIGVGVSVARWADPAVPAPYVAPVGADAPSRLNDGTGPPTYYSVQPGSTFEVRAVVDGVEAPLDVALGGRLFTAWGVQWSGCPPNLSQSAGQSSVAAVTVLHLVHLGFYQLGFSRSGGGALFVPFCVER